MSAGLGGLVGVGVGVGGSLVWTFQVEEKWVIEDQLGTKPTTKRRT